MALNIMRHGMVCIKGLHTRVSRVCMCARACVCVHVTEMNARGGSVIQEWRYIELCSCE